MSRLSTAPGPWVVNGCIAILCLIWGSTWLVIREGLRDLPPLTSAGVRFTVAALLFVPLVALLGRREGGDRPPLWMSLVMGLLNFAVSYGIVYESETVISSSLTSVLWAVFPIMMAIASHRFLPGERLGPSQWIGFGIGFVGVTLLFLTDLRNAGHDAIVIGAIVLISPLASAVANTLIKLHGTGVSSLRLNLHGLLIGASVLSLAAALFEDPLSARWTPRAVASVAYLAVFGTVVTFGLYFWLLRFAKASRLSLIAYVIPAIALLLGWSFGEEAVGATTLAGTGLILGGVWAAARG